MALSRKKKALYAFSITVGIVLALEIIFRALGLFAPQTPFTSFKNNNGDDLVRYNLNGIKPEFRAQKKKGAFRIMIAGGSTALGFPYQPRSSFGLRLRDLLEKNIPGLEVELINLGKMSMDSGAVEAVVTKALEYHPDLMIVYSGHNDAFSFSNRQPQNDATISRLLEKSRVARAGAGAVKVILGRGMPAFMQAREEGPETGLELPTPSSISASQHQRIMREYRSNLEKIASGCRSSGVPLILCTMTSNLRDWPPEYHVYPSGLTEEHWSDSMEGIKKARTLLERRHYEEALDLLESSRAVAPGYAPISFWIGRIKTAMAESQALHKSSSAEPSKNSARIERLRTEALSDFKRALSEESRTVVSHRAPVEFNPIVREVAKDHGAWLMDTERLFEENSYLAPGFDWFDDHCHPRLHGQQLMAEAIFEILRDQGLPLPRDKWKEPLPWNEKDFALSRNIDDRHLHHVLLRIGIFLGLQKDLPQKSAATRERLRSAARKDPDDPLPVILEALIALHYGDTDQASELLSTWYPDRTPLLEKCLGRYFSDSVDLRQGVFMARLSSALQKSALGKPPLSNLLKSGLFTEEKTNAPEQKKPLSHFTHVLDLTGAGKTP